MGYRFEGVDLRDHPEEYRIGRGEQGVFHAEPYKGELLPLWGFKDVDTAERASEGIHARYLSYRESGDFVGMDVARKFLQMGYTRARRYAKHVGGNKSRPRDEEDGEKARVAEIFRQKWGEVTEDPEYGRLKELHLERYERNEKSG